MRNSTGDTAFVIGNGPSLRVQDLTAIHNSGLPSFACNRIHEKPKGESRGMYAHTPWRPTAYFLSDKNWNGEVARDVEYHIAQGYPCWIRDDLLSNTSEITHPHVSRIMPCEHDYINDGASVGWHDDETPCQFGGSLAVAIQICIWRWQPRRIALIGCDMGSGHFYPTTYDPDPKWLERTRIRAHEIALAECWSRGISIYNATIGGRLEVYPRLSLEELL